MANSNVNIANKLYAYIAHGCDITTDITEVYKNSMIFIGDERQIYVPVMNAYVGIGMTAYNSTLNKIASLEDQFNQLAENVSTGNISKIYANYSTDELNSNITPSNIHVNDNDWALTNDITIKGIGDYNPDTHYARRNNTGEQYIVKDVNGQNIHIISNGALTTKPYQNGTLEIDTYTNATSGITVTPHWGNTELVHNEVTDEWYEKRVGNYITIDDSLTWSYMTSAYSYSLAFSQNYADSEINRLYHNLIGDATVTYVPVACSSIIHNVTNELSKYDMSDGIDAFITKYNTDNPSTYLTYRDEGNSNYKFFLIERNNNLYVASYTGNSYISGVKTYHNVDIINDIAAEIDGKSGTEAILPNGKYVIDKNADAIDIQNNFWQLYVRDEQYNSSYNMNIKDGIQTLKEVAYLLDILSDGSLGEVTYITYQQYNTATNNGSTATNTYHIITPTNNNPKTTDIYAYWVNNGNPDNLGIQIAYSIAGNQKQIDDLHKHAELLEKGETTLRSIQSRNTYFANLVLEGGTTQWADTDTNQGAASFGNRNGNPASTHPNATVQSNVTNYQPSYLVGDVNLKIDLQTSTVYATTYQYGNKNYHYTDASGVEWYGCYTIADMNALDPNGTYYARSGNYDDNSNDFTFGDPITGNDIILNPALQDTQYYWQPGFVDENNNGNNDNWSFDVNKKITSISVKDLTALQDNESIKGTTYSKLGGSGTTAVQEFILLDENGNLTSTKYTATANTTAWEVLSETGIQSGVLNQNNRVGFVSGYSHVKLHAKTDENKLATTQWTEVYVDEKLENVNARLADISDIAASSVDQLIGKLDSEYKYSDFATYWSTYLGDHQSMSQIPGTPDYETTYEREYKLFVNRATDNWETYWANYCFLTGHEVTDHTSSTYINTLNTFSNRAPEIRISSGGDYRLSYITNSEYVYNTVQKDGTVTAESRELPTDTLRVKTDFWGEQNSSNKFQYSDITGLTDNDTDSLLNALYAWKEDTTHDNQIFVKVINQTYIPKQTSIAANYNDDYLLTENGEFTSLNGEIDKSKIKAAWDSNNSNDKYWRQLYVFGPEYLELDLQNAINPGTEENAKITVNIVQNNITFTLTKQNSGKILVSTNVNGILDNSDANLKYISNKGNTSKQYLSVENKHFSYVDNGNGENQFEVTAHITKLEDATPDNTGFADAYDVRSFIENMFKWVNISASVTTNSLQRDAFYKNTSYEMYITDTPSTLYERTENGTEPNITVTFSTVSGSNINYGWYWSDTNKFVTNAGASENINPETGLPTSATINKEGHNLINGSYVTKRFKSQDISAGTLFTNAYNYYICLEKEYTNPLNLKETDYGKPTPVQP